MTGKDRLILARCFLFSMRLLFSVYYSVSNGADKKLFKDYEGLSDDLKEWYNPEQAPASTAPGG